MGLLPMDADILSACDDRVFKKLLTAPEALPALLNLVPAIIMRPVTEVLVRNNEIPPGDTDEKAERFDINCTAEDGSQIDIEMQSRRMEEKETGEHRNLKGKSVYYLCDLHSSQSSKGKSYDELARSYQVTFCGYTIFPRRKNFINSYSMRHDEDGELLSDAITAKFVELTKLQDILKKPVGDMTDLERWAVFFRYAEYPNYREVVNQVIESKEALNVAGEILMGISTDERERAIFRSRRMYQSDQESNLRTAEYRGERRGQQEGRQEEKFDIAKNLLGLDVPIDKIIKSTGLTRAEVEKLRQ